MSKKTPTESKEEQKQDEEENMDLPEYLERRHGRHRGMYGDEDVHYPHEQYEPTFVQESSPIGALDGGVVRGIMSGWLGNVSGAPDHEVMARIEPCMRDGDDYNPQKVGPGRFVRSYQ
jgi:hypothetical protein